MFLKQSLIMKAKQLPLKSDGTIDWEKVELPKIDFDLAKIEYIEPNEEDKRRLAEYNKKMAEYRNRINKSKKNG